MLCYKVNADTAKAQMSKLLTNYYFQQAFNEVLECMEVSEYLTIKKVISNIFKDRSNAEAKGDFATCRACDELLGKHLAMFHINYDVTMTDLTPEARKDYLSRIARYLPKPELSPTSPEAQN